MFPCCKLCYSKYLDSDKIVDEEILKAEIERKKIQDFNYEKICKCECHIKGRNILH